MIYDNEGCMAAAYCDSSTVADFGSGQLSDGRIELPSRAANIGPGVGCSRAIFIFVDYRGSRASK